MKNTGNKFDIWVTATIDVSAACFHRITIDSIEMLGDSLMNAWRVAIFSQHISQQGGELVPGQGLPEKYKHIQLYHIRKHEFLNKNRTLSTQKVLNGDVFVSLRDDDDELSYKLGFLKAQDFPVQIPPVPVGKVMIEIQEIESLKADVAGAQRTKLIDAVEAKPGAFGFSVDLKKAFQAIKQTSKKKDNS